MKKVGFVISKKENERRRALLPSDITRIKNKDYLRIENGYGKVLGIKDEEYYRIGVQVVDREEALMSDVICDPKIGDADYLHKLHNQTIFGWIHAVQNKAITDSIVDNQLTAYAWEDMYHKGRHIFWRNNEIAGEAAIMHAFQCFGIMPYYTKVAVLGKGNIANGALKILTLLGADVTVYGRKTEELFRDEISQYDILVNAILWDTSRKDHIIYKEDLARMKPNSMIIDISCDRCGAVETSIPTTIENPVYECKGILHYVVDHTPTLFYKTISVDISKIICEYIDDLICDTPNEILRKACIIDKGYILNPAINAFQKR